jgi:hypothetical protein
MRLSPPIAAKPAGLTLKANQEMSLTSGPAAPSMDDQPIMAWSGL